MVFSKKSQQNTFQQIAKYEFSYNETFDNL